MVFQNVDFQAKYNDQKNNYSFLTWQKNCAARAGNRQSKCKKKPTRPVKIERPLCSLRSSSGHQGCL